MINPGEGGKRPAKNRMSGYQTIMSNKPILLGNENVDNPYQTIYGNIRKMFGNKKGVVLWALSKAY